VKKAREQQELSFSNDMIRTNLSIPLAALQLFIACCKKNYDIIMYPQQQAGCGASLTKLCEVNAQDVSDSLNAKCLRKLWF
jgi:hypothetical protein